MPNYRSSDNYSRGRTSVSTSTSPASGKRNITPRKSNELVSSQSHSISTTTSSTSSSPYSSSHISTSTSTSTTNLFSTEEPIPPRNEIPPSRSSPIQTPRVQSHETCAVLSNDFLSKVVSDGFSSLIKRGYPTIYHTFQ